MGWTIRIALTVVVVFAALSLLGLQFLSQSLNAGLVILPKLLLGAALVLVACCRWMGKRARPTLRVTALGVV